MSTHARHDSDEAPSARHPAGATPGRRSRAGSLTSVLRLLFTRRWLTALLVAALFCVLCVFLGLWQWGRYEDKSHRAQLINTYYAAEPVPLDQALPAGTTTFPADQQWRRVRISGTYDPQGRFMVRNRPQNITYGFEVLDTLRLPGGDAIVIDRGWVPNAERADVVPDVPPAPSGEVEVVGWLRPGEKNLERSLPTGQLASIDVGEVARATGLTLRPTYVVLDSERTADGTAPPRPKPLIPPTTDTGPHFAYALQWWGAAPVGFVLVFVYLRREFRDSLAEGDARRVETPRKPKKTRIWDEEDG